jgi:hypothetical protein
MLNRHEAIHWKTNEASGVTIVDGVIKEWPEALGALPTEDDIQQWIVEYQAWKVGKDAAKADETAKEALIEAKKREQAITALVAEGKLTKDGKIK